MMEVETVIAANSAKCKYVPLEGYFQVKLISRAQFADLAIALIKAFADIQLSYNQ